MSLDSSAVTSKAHRRPPHLDTAPPKKEAKAEPSLISSIFSRIQSGFQKSVEEDKQGAVLAAMGGGTAIITLEHAPSTVAFMTNAIGGNLLLSGASMLAGNPLSWVASGITSLTGATAAEIGCAVGADAMCKVATVCTAGSCAAAVGPALFLIGSGATVYGAIKLYNQGKQVTVQVIGEVKDEQIKDLKGAALHLQDPERYPHITGGPSSSSEAKTLVPRRLDSDMTVLATAAIANGVLSGTNVQDMSPERRRLTSAAITALIPPSKDLDSKETKTTPPKAPLDRFRALGTILSLTGGNNSFSSSIQRWAKDELNALWDHKDEYLGEIKKFLTQNVLVQLNKYFPPTPLDPKDTRRAVGAYLLYGLSKKVAVWAYEHSKYHKTLNKLATVQLTIKAINFLIPAYFLTRIFANSIDSYTGSNSKKTNVEILLDQFELFLPPITTPVDKVFDNRDIRQHFKALVNPKSLWHLLSSLAVGLLAGAVGRDLLKVALSDQRVSKFVDNGSQNLLLKFAQFYPVIYPIGRYLIQSLRKPEEGDISLAIKFLGETFEHLQNKPLIREAQERIRHNYRVDEMQQSLVDIASATLLSNTVRWALMNFIISSKFKSSLAGKTINATLIVGPGLFHLYKYAQTLLRPKDESGVAPTSPRSTRKGKTPAKAVVISTSPVRTGKGNLGNGMGEVTPPLSPASASKKRYLTLINSTHDTES